MSTILLILKIIGIVILSVLAFALALILIISVIPFRYSADIAYHEKLNGKASVSWLLHFIDFKLFFRDSQTEKVLRILGFRTRSGSKKADAESSEEEEAEEEPPAEDPKEKKKSKKKKPKEKKKRTFDETVDLIFEKIDDITDKIDFATDERSLNAVDHVLKIVFQILRHILPHKLSGKLTYGMESPADTGKILGWITATVPIHKNNIEITPDFNEKVFDTDMKIKGRIFIGYIILAAFRLILNRNVIYVLRHYKKHFG